MTISPQLELAYNRLTSEFEGQYRDLGTQVLWVWRNGVLVKRTIAGTSTLSQHVGGNAWDVAPLTQATEHVVIIDTMVSRARSLGCRVLWRGVRDHFPHHAHIEGVPKYSQAELAQFYETEDEDMEVKELIAEIQAAGVRAGWDLGDFTPLDDRFPPGADGEIGPKTRALLDAMCIGPDVASDHKHRIEWPPMTDIVTGTPI